MTDPATFRAQLHTIFRADHGAISVPLRLVGVTGPSMRGDCQQFSLFFDGPAAVILEQGTYSFDHDALGSLVMFIVPVIGSNDERTVYQACFSHLPQPPGPASSDR